MKFAILADIHLGDEEYYKGILRKVNQEAENLVLDFVQKMNTYTKPEFVVILGDLVADSNKLDDQKNAAHAIKLLARLKCPIHYVAGNCDLKNITEDKLAKLFNQDNLYYSFDSNDFHFIILFSKAIKKKLVLIDEEQKTWLQDDLAKTDKKSIVFVHHGLADQNLKGNPWFEGRPEICLIANREEIRNIFHRSGKVAAVFNGHLHWDKLDVHDQIPYFTIQSLVENEDDQGIASKAYAVINICEDKVDVEIKGNYPKKFSYSKHVQTAPGLSLLNSKF
ncbi:MAG: metallophosphoesterase [Patescibacteria group bacterium]|nr:metallophosphoesterase [Patescibacteria group bacterium]